MTFSVSVPLSGFYFLMLIVFLRPAKLLLRFRPLIGVLFFNVNTMTVIREFCFRPLIGVLFFNFTAYATAHRETVSVPLSGFYFLIKTAVIMCLT